MLWSSISIPGSPTTMMVDASCNLMGWESEFCDRLFATMKRRGLSLKGKAPVRSEHPEDLQPCLVSQEEFNSVLLFSHAHGQRARLETTLRNYWEWLNSYIQPVKLFVACSWDSYDPEVSQQILKSPKTFAPLALAPQSPLTPREAGLFTLKFFTEMDLHSSKEITGKMVWFSCSKARELLRRRRLAGKVGVRC